MPITGDMQVIHHGGKHTVTGSCHEFRLGNSGILIDCGLFQGQELQGQDLQGQKFQGKPSQAVSFPVAHIKALVVTHAHIDHIGRIPWLLAAGFKGPVYCTPATAELIPLMLEDGLKIQGFNYGQTQRILELIKKLYPAGWLSSVDAHYSGEYFYLHPLSACRAYSWLGLCGNQTA